MQKLEIKKNSKCKMPKILKPSDHFLQRAFEKTYLK